MVRDEYVRQHAGASTRFGATSSTGKPDTPPRQSEAPSRAPSRRQGDGSSSSSSSSSSPSGKERTFAKNANGETPSQNLPVEDVTIWKLGVQKLVATGSSDKNARSFLGKQIQTYGKPAVCQAVIGMLAQDALEPTEYIVAALQGRNGKYQQKSKVEHSLDAVSRVIAEKEAQRDAIGR
jgi:hypothetical protein